MKRFFSSDVFCPDDFLPGAKNASFEFNATIDGASVFTESSTFTLASGSTLAALDVITLFQF